MQKGEQKKADSLVRKENKGLVFQIKQKKNSLYSFMLHKIRVSFIFRVQSNLFLSFPFAIFFFIEKTETTCQQTWKKEHINRNSSVRANERSATINTKRTFGPKAERKHKYYFNPHEYIAASRSTTKHIDYWFSFIRFGCAIVRRHFYLFSFCRLFFVNGMDFLFLFFFLLFFWLLCDSNSNANECYSVFSSRLNFV